MTGRRTKDRKGKKQEYCGIKEEKGEIGRMRRNNEVRMTKVKVVGSAPKVSTRAAMQPPTTNVTGGYAMSPGYAAVGPIDDKVVSHTTNAI